MHVIEQYPAFSSMGLGLLLAATAILPVAAQLPATQLSTVFPPGGQAGSSVEVTVQGSDLEEPARLDFSHSGITATTVDPTHEPTTKAG